MGRKLCKMTSHTSLDILNRQRRQCLSVPIDSSIKVHARRSQHLMAAFRRKIGIVASIIDSIRDQFFVNLVDVVAIQVPASRDIAKRPPICKISFGMRGIIDRITNRNHFPWLASTLSVAWIWVCTYSCRQEGSIAWEAASMRREPRSLAWHLIRGGTQTQ